MMIKKILFVVMMGMGIAESAPTDPWVESPKPRDRGLLTWRVSISLTLLMDTTVLESYLFWVKSPKPLAHGFQTWRVSISMTVLRTPTVLESYLIWIKSPKPLAHGL